jgi:protein tyrosine phosphatase (PTP) superfamily phosphohydrolase (DUF442 family)
MPRNRYGVLLLMLLLTAGCTLFNDNLRPVERGEFWRSAQMSPDRLEYTIRKHGIKTVISLRGANVDESWYRDEVGKCAELGVVHYDLPWTMRRIPEPESLQQLVAWFETAEKPILVHCQAGIHRAGVASASYKLYKGADVDSAREQFGIYFGGAPIGNVLDLYEGSEIPFAEWVRTKYPAIYEANTKVVHSRTSTTSEGAAIQ